ncbi:hypothetical protein CMI42_04280 [Candidatus Pacearchaeota archaeon]|nr:hypothetical protein [Candidatus Pacearchaeota archaeon]|tara:strand:+ start:1368 stop:1880 length:513 start_codon:yes stop_codon:yes gene_type:complete
MKIINLNPNQIITLNDFPIYSEQALKQYFEAYRKSNETEIPFCPVIPREIVVQYLDKELIRKYKEFEEHHQESEYFLLDGTHRTTAATLTNSLIRAIVFTKDREIEEAKKLIEKGELLYNKVIKKNLRENCIILNNHFTKEPNFQTVKEKTKRMIEGKKIPEYMGSYCRT